jgi:hypothetical protein
MLLLLVIRAMRAGPGQAGPWPDLDLAYQALRLRPQQVDGQQSVIQRSRKHFHPVSQDKRAFELACRDAAVKVFTAVIVALASADHQFVVFKAQIKLIRPETCDGQRDPEPFCFAILDGIFSTL